jgi:hypothetical protein
MNLFSQCIKTKINFTAGKARQFVLLWSLNSLSFFFFIVFQLHLLYYIDMILKLIICFILGDIVFMILKKYPNIKLMLDVALFFLIFFN